MNAYRTLAVAALALGALTAQAGSYGENYPAMPESTSTLTRAAVIAELVAAREAGTLPRDGDWSNAPAPLALAGNPFSREAVRTEAIAAQKAGAIVSGEH